MKIYSISEISKLKIQQEDNIKLMLIRERWRALFFDISTSSQIIKFKNDIIYIKSYNSTLKHYIFINKHIIIKKIQENMEIKFEIKDIKIS